MLVRGGTAALRRGRCCFAGRSGRAAGRRAWRGALLSITGNLLLMGLYLAIIKYASYFFF